MLALTKMLPYQPVYIDCMCIECNKKNHHRKIIFVQSYFRRSNWPSPKGCRATPRTMLLYRATTRTTLAGSQNCYTKTPTRGTTQQHDTETGTNLQDDPETKPPPAKESTILRLALKKMKIMQLKTDLRVSKTK